MRRLVQYSCPFEANSRLCDSILLDVFEPKKREDIISSVPCDIYVFVCVRLPWAVFFVSSAAVEGFLSLICRLGDFVLSFGLLWTVSLGRIFGRLYALVGVLCLFGRLGRGFLVSLHALGGVRTICVCVLRVFASFEFQRGSDSLFWILVFSGRC